MPKPIFLLSALLALITACTPLKIRWDYDPDADFSRYKSFDWMPAPLGDQQERAWDNPFLEKRIKQALIGAMGEKGFEKTAANADLLIAFRLGEKKKTRVDVYGYGDGYYHRPWGHRGTNVRHFREGTLIIDLVDPATKQLVWRGWGIGDLGTDLDPQMTQEYLGDVVQDILKHYPPY